MVTQRRAQHAERRAPVGRPSLSRVRSWTGRAAMSCSTDSSVPRFVTAGTRRTRVSEMRPHTRAAALHAVESRRPGLAARERRGVESPGREHRGRG